MLLELFSSPSSVRFVASERISAQTWRTWNTSKLDEGAVSNSIQTLQVRLFSILVKPASFLSLKEVKMGKIPSIFSRIYRLYSWLRVRLGFSLYQIRDAALSSGKILRSAWIDRSEISVDHMMRAFKSLSESKAESYKLTFVSVCIKPTFI